MTTYKLYQCFLDAAVSLLAVTKNSGGYCTIVERTRSRDNARCNPRTLVCYVRARVRGRLVV